MENLPPSFCPSLVFSLSSGYPYQPSQNEVLREKLEVLGKKEEERLSAGQAKLLRLLELKDSQVRQLTSDQLDTLWSPTFDWHSRFYCFWTAPLVLILLNSVLVRKFVFFLPQMSTQAHSLAPLSLNLHGASRPVLRTSVFLPRRACHGGTRATSGSSS